MEDKQKKVFRPLVAVDSLSATLSLQVTVYRIHSYVGSRKIDCSSFIERTNIIGIYLLYP
jgi:hypothetical protein